jgi:hydrogenase maturation protease
MRGAIVALGNPRMGDDGAGPAALEHLGRMSIPAGVALIDGSTPRLGLLHILADVDAAVQVDAADFGGPPGAIQVFAPAQTDARRRTPLSAHAGDALQVIALGLALGQCPRRGAVYAIQPARIAPAEGLTPAGAGGFPPWRRR